ncbi:MAG: DUF3737 family protein [Bifidobacterium sp.]|uniref:DUF3737 family protein n=1 Tax=Bifidobacterium fermentum TaxID=3059035 RepID=A0AB39UIJ0_9BIFI
MTNYHDAFFEGERSLFAEHDATITSVTFGEGESPLKESRNIALDSTVFQWKYPLWYSRHITVRRSIFESMSRSGIWYTDDISLADTTCQAPKLFRRCNRVDLERVHFSDAEETLWHCRDIHIHDVQANGDYLGMDCDGVYAEHLDVVGNYVFDGARNLEIHDSTFVSKDAFWNCENVAIYDSVINGEYLGWNTKNLTLVNCTIRSNQGLCYIDHLTMRNCRLLHTDLAFEYCTDIDADIRSSIMSVKNPISGIIRAERIDSLIMDRHVVDPTKTKIEITQIPATVDSSNI